jgi:hypothetical protein
MIKNGEESRMQQISRMSAKTSLIGVSLLLMALSVPGQASAAWNVKDDKSHDYLQSIRDYTKYVRDYYSSHGQQGRPVTQVISGEAWPAGQTMPQVDEGFGLQHACGTGAALTAAQIKSRLGTGFTLPDNANNEAIALQQKEVCGAIRVLANIRYNESVQLVGTTLPAIKRKYETSVLRGINDNGGRSFDNAGSNQVSLQAAQFEFDMAIATFRERQSQYEQYQGLLTAYNDQLGRRVLNGGGTADGSPSSFLGSLIGASVVQAALRLGN